MDIKVIRENKANKVFKVILKVIKDHRVIKDTKVIQRDTKGNRDRLE
jgi:hypothetical protein